VIKMPIPEAETALESISRAKQAVRDVRTRTRCVCGKCKTCQNRRYSAKWRANHPGPAHLSRVRRNGVAVGKTPWANLRGDTTERAIVASAAANHYPGRFADWSAKRLAELRCKWASI